MASSQQFCLRWNNHQSTLISVFDHLLESGTLVDCTLAAEGQFLKAHKVVLSACSPYLEAILSQHYEKHPIIILKDATFHELKSMLDYMYRGEVNISQEQLPSFLKAAESLQIKGLTDSGAMTENRDQDRSREMEHTRDLNRIDRSLGVPILPKRMDVRKQIPILPRARSPLVGLPSNFMINIPVDNRKSNKHSVPQEVNSGSPKVVHSREGSVSPTLKRKRLSQTAQSDDSKINSKPPVENNHIENHKDENKSKESFGSQKLSNSVGLPSKTVEGKKKANSENKFDSDAPIVKSEVKSENVDFSDEAQNEDSVEDLTVEEEEEEMDDMDISQPGPSTASNSHVAGIPWHVAGEGNGEELLLASQQDSQDGGVLRLECVKCHKTYSSPHTLRRHVRLECGKEPRFLCPYCPHRTKQRYNLMLHIGRTHRETLTNQANLPDM